MVRCSLLGCKSDSETKMPGLSFHSFPEHYNLRRNWIIATGRTDWTPKPSSKLCSRHFDNKMLVKKKKLTLLLPNAVPILTKATSNSSPSSQIKMPDPIQLPPLMTDIKSESDPADEEDQLSDADQPFEDMMPLSNYEVPLTNAQDPLSEVKVEEPDAPTDELIIKLEEVEVNGPEVEETGPREQETDPGEQETGPEEETGAGEQETRAAVEVTDPGDPLHASKDVFRAANDASLIRILHHQIAKLRARCSSQRQKLKTMAARLKRRDNTIRCLRAQLTSFIVERAGTECGTSVGRTQIQSTNNTATGMKSNRKIVIIKRVPNRSKSPANTQRPTSANIGRTSQVLQDTSENGQKTSVLKDILQSPKTGVKRTLNIVERSSLGKQDTSDALNKTADVRMPKSAGGGQRMSDNRQQSSIAVKPIVKTPTLVIEPIVDNRQVFSSVSSSVQNTSDKRKKLSMVVKPISNIVKPSTFVVQSKSDNRKISSVGVQQTSVSRLKPIVIKQSSIMKKSPTFVIKPTSDVKNPKIIGQSKWDTRQMTVDLQRMSENQQNSSLVVQPTSDRQMSSVGVQRTSDIRQNSLVIQIDGMHNTVLQPKLVRLDDKNMEMG